MRKQFLNRPRNTFIRAVPPLRSSPDYSPAMERSAASILYRSPLPSKTNHAIYILNAAAIPDAHEVEFDHLLPYVLARLPGEDELVAGTEYEVIFFAGGGGEGVTATKKNKPGWGWFLQAYHVLSRAMRKRIQRLYLVHERKWVRMLVETFSTIVSPKFRRKIVHASSLSALAQYIPIQDILIPPSAYLQDRRILPNIHVPNASGRRAFSAKQPLPRDLQGRSRLPRVLRETTNFVLMKPNVKTEGLFRIPPNARSKEILREAYDRGQKFIAWKERDVTLPQHVYDGAKDTDSIVAELDQADTYGVHLAGALIKLWYQELRAPLVPQSAYGDLKKMYGNADVKPSLQNLVELFSPNSGWSVLPTISREIMTRHLLPLLSAVVVHQEANKMNAENLAVCFAPTLICGTDQIEDAKMSSILRRILATATNLWSNGLREACGVDAEAFGRDLREPTSKGDYEDPLYEVEYPDHTTTTAELDQQRVGIIMEDNEELEDCPPIEGISSLISDITTGSSSSSPPLPPRPQENVGPQGLVGSKLPIKTAPPLPPRKPISGEPQAGSGSNDTSFKGKSILPLTEPSRIITNASDITESPTRSTQRGQDSPVMLPSRSRASTTGSANLSPIEILVANQGSEIKRKPVTPKSSGDS